MSTLSDSVIGERLSLSEEKREIEGKLGDVSRMKERLAELYQVWRNIRPSELYSV